MNLYKYNKRSGIWDHQRSVTPETKDEWLHVYKKDEPSEHFHVSKNKPKIRPSNAPETIVTRTSKTDATAAIGTEAPALTAPPTLITSAKPLPGAYFPHLL